MVPSGPFAALSDPIKVFDGLDHTYFPEKFLAHRSSRVTFDLDFNLVIFNHCKHGTLDVCPYFCVPSNCVELV